MLTVTLYTFDGDKDIEEGKIAWDGTQFLIKPDSPFLNTMLSEPIYVKDKADEDAELVYSGIEPERFLRGLNAYCCGVAVRASMAKDE